MKNREKKVEVLTNGDYHKYTEKRKSAFKDGNGFEFTHVLDEQTGEYIEQLNIELLEMSEENAFECERIRNNKNRQRAKIEDHIRFLVKSAKNGFCDLFFITFTFTDETMKKSAETRKRAVIKALGFCDDYIVNIDYGANTEREHFHAVISLQKGYTARETNHKGYVKLTIFDRYERLYGFTSAKLIDISDEKSPERLAKYISKLVLHSVKVQQAYVSVKKGSRFQLWKKLQAKVSLMADGTRTKNKVFGYYRKMVALEKGEMMEMFELFGLDFDVDDGSKWSDFLNSESLAENSAKVQVQQDSGVC